MFHKMEHLSLAGDRGDLTPLKVIFFLYEEGLYKEGLAKKQSNDGHWLYFTKKNCVSTTSSSKRLPWRSLKQYLKYLSIH